MSKWKRVAAVLAALIFLSCVAIGWLAWLWVNPAGGDLFAGLRGRATPTITAGTSSPLPTSNPPGQSRPTVAPGTGPEVGAFGLVTQIADSAVSISTPEGISTTVTIGATTRLFVVGVSHATPSDIQPGDKVLVLGSRRGGEPFDPRAIIVAPGSYNQQNVKVGRLQSVTGQQIHITTAEGAVSAYLSGDTQYVNLALRPAGASNLTNGMTVIVIGQPTSDGSLTAQLVILVPMPGQSP